MIVINAYCRMTAKEKSRRAAALLTRLFYQRRL